MNAKLQQLAAVNPATLRLLTAPVVPESRRGFAWLSWRPLTAAAAGLIIGIFGATAVWAMTSPRAVPWMKREVTIANPGFEDAASPLARGVPTRIGVWSGDYTERVGAEQGITPRSGKQMLRFLRSDSEVEPAGASTYVGDLFQVVDLSPWRAAIADGTALAELSASFNSVPGTRMVFQTCLWAFNGDPARLSENWNQRLREQLAYGSGTAKTAGDRPQWQRVTGRMLVPANAEFLVIELKAIPSSRSAGKPVVFGDVYADDAELVLRSPGEHLALTRGRNR